MDGIVTSSSFHEEGIVEMVASLASGTATAEMRMLVPRRVLEWFAGQQFRCVVDEGCTKKANAVTLHCVVVAQDSSATLLSYGGLPIRVVPTLGITGHASHAGHGATLNLIPHTSVTRKRYQKYRTKTQSL